MDHRYKKLIVLVDLGSYSKAAKELHISQPAMTISIASLEKSLGKKLIAKKKPNVELTPEGKIVYKSARKIQKEIDSMHSLLENTTETSEHVGLIDSIAHLVYTASRDNIILNDIEVMVDNSRRILSDLASNQIDYGFITGQPTQLASNIKVSKLHDEPFVFVRKASLVTSNKVEIIDDWLAFNRASTSYHHFMKQFKNTGIKVNAVFYSTSLELLKDMAKNGNGTALLPKHFVQDELDDGSLQVLNTPELYRPIWIVTKKETHSPLLRNLTLQINKLLAKNSNL